MKSFLIIGLIALFASPVLAQRQGRVEETKDTLITLLQKKRVELKGEQTTSDASLSASTTTDKKGVKSTAPGYRVQIYSGADRSKAYAEQARFKRMFADLDSYITYDEPNFRVKVGDFTNRREAQELMDALKKSFGSVFLFPETVNVVN
ncbi:Sporulation related domain-containing protein [bacterium A37T11]|nr:Sporulation related domain-containing protein [bacterium A37T11]